MESAAKAERREKQREKQHAPEPPPVSAVKTEKPPAPPRPLTTYEVLAEEYKSLHGAQPKRSDPVFEDKHLRDLGALARTLIKEQEKKEKTGKKHGSPTLGAELVERVSSPLKAYEKAGFPISGGKAKALRTELVKHINEFLSRRSDAAEAFIKRIPRDSPWSSEFEAVGAEDWHRRNWLVLENSFPDLITRLRDLELQNLFHHVRRTGHAALCLSGGGIRSATFALGLVQALARWGMLEKFQYLSTVSGGGYLGSWLSAWIHRAGFAQVLEQLRTVPQSALNGEQLPVRHLRSYSNYLSPQVGPLSADTWTLVATYLRNLLLNWLVLLPVMAAAICLPHLMAALIGRNPLLAARNAGEGWEWATWAMLALCVFLSLSCGVWAVRFTFKEWSQPGEELPGVGAAHRRVLRHCLGPLLVSMGLNTAIWYWFNVGEGLPGRVAISLFGVYGAVLTLLGWYERPWKERLVASALGFLLGTSSYIGLYGLDLVARKVAKDGHIDALYLYTTLAFPMAVGLLVLGSFICIGLAGEAFPDSAREWAARFNAWLLMAMTTWLVISGLVLIGPSLVEWRWTSFVGTGGVSGLVTALLVSRTSEASPKKEATSPGLKEAAIAALQQWPLLLAAPVFASFIVILLSMLDGMILQRLHQAYDAFLLPKLQELPFGRIFGKSDNQPIMVVALAMGGLGLVGWAFGRFINTNLFSLQGLYRERLIRAYLGASRPVGEQQPDPFTGFDEQDDLSIHKLWPQPDDKAPASPKESESPRPPIHVINMALNLVGGTNLAWQQRKARSFTVSPFHAGASDLGYRRTKTYGGKQGITLGTAMTISGAAANPNMGYHSSPAVTFLMTLFNARLGCWLGNPGPAGQQSYMSASPNSSVKFIFGEMFGRTNDTSEYVHLSDGGHFENLGLYEMVLRRCRFLVVSDASCDAEFTFADLGDAIRKIRIDLGVPIEFESFSIGPQKQDSPPSVGQYWAVARIRYSVVDMDLSDKDAKADDYDGLLVYVKPVIYGHQEPRDVLHYSKTNAEFPHETTADQFFDERQFESYRSLGHFIGERLCNQLRPGLEGFPLSPQNGEVPSSWLPGLLQQLTEPKQRS